MKKFLNLPILNNPFMKTLLIILACVMVFSCTKKTTHYQASGTITGLDLRMCACCGGYFIKMTGSDTTYHFYNFPAGSTIDSTHFPINVSFNYTAPASNGCGVIYITSMVQN